ncbi:response regulator [Paenibacillus humicola]|uniref:response regulator n=1 Tax=Paenibacillus humicola TaxID=3110540 RepID=UPI00237BB6BB|nr:response regulator [Paenibacillus humicola]
MYRLLIVDDEEIITDSLYEVFARFMPDRLDVCKAYSGHEALGWMSRTRIDIVLTDIRMPGMSGLELTEEIRTYWPRCKIVFLTGHSEFDYAYQAIQMADVRYVLKTEGYDKVTQTVLDVMDDIDCSRHTNRLVEQSREQTYALELIAQGDYFRHLLQDSRTYCRDQEALVNECGALHIELDPTVPIVMILGRISYPDQVSYIEKSKTMTASRMIWNSYLSGKTRHISIVDKYEDIVWFLQPNPDAAEKFDHHLIRFLEGTLELIQETCLESLGVTASFTVSGTSCKWEAITLQYERLRRLQQMNVDDDISIIVTDRFQQTHAPDAKEENRIGQKAEILAAHLEADRKEKFYACFEEIAACSLHPCANIERTSEAYYAVALVLFSYINRWGLNGQIGEYRKLMRLDDHPSMKEGFQYLSQIANRIFQIKRLDEKERATYVIDQICHYINEHLSGDLSLVRLAEINYFNPTYLSRFFKQERGINLSEYIDQCRIRKAMELLKDGDIKVREVAVSVGYEAAHSFTRFFKKATGMTPQEYRDTIPIDYPRMM